MGFFDKIKAGLTKTREALSDTLGSVFAASEIDEDFYDELEESLILADLGMDTAIRAVSRLRPRVNNNNLKTVEQAREVIGKAPGCKLVDDLANTQYPMPLDTTDQDIVFVGRSRPDLTDKCGLALWCCGDQVRKGAATNAIQIAELLVK